MGSFITILISVWALAMGAWFLVSKYFKSSDIDRVKARLLGTSRAPRPPKARRARLPKSR